MSLLLTNRAVFKSGEDISRAGLVAEWLHESGSLFDTSDNSYNLSAINSPTLINGINGEANGAYNYNGASQYMSAGNILELESVQQFSVSVWMRKAGNYRAHVGSSVSGQSNNNIAYNWHTNHKMEAAVRAGQSGHVATVNIFSLNVWHNFVIVFDGTEIDATKILIYADGNLESTQVNPPLSNVAPGLNLPWEIGRYLGGFFSIADITRQRVYNRLLLPEEIPSFYAEKTI